MRLGFVGCGAIASGFHLPALRFQDHFTGTMLADSSAQRLDACAKRFGIRQTSTSYRDMVGKVDAVVLSVPNNLHAPMAVEFLGQGIHVLVEKPMAMGVDEARGVVEAERASKARLAIGMVRRQFNSTRLFRDAIASGVIRNPTRFVGEEGAPLDWPVTTGYLFSKATAGGGVTLTQGVHMIDTVLWAFGRDSTVLEYNDDSLGGLEADSSLRLTLRRGEGTLTGELNFSFLRTLSNEICVSGEEGTLVYKVGDKENIYMRNSGAALRLAEDHGKPKRLVEYFARQLDAFGEMIEGKESNCATASEGLAALQLIQSCYEKRKPVGLLPWESNGMEERARAS
jgi:predicted dehydrogenase